MIKGILTLTPPLRGKNKVDALIEFVDKNQTMGILDRRYARQVLEMLHNIRVTRLRGIVTRDRKRKTRWILLMTINDRKTFRGDGDMFEEALIVLLEDFEGYTRQAAAS